MILHTSVSPADVALQNGAWALSSGGESAPLIRARSVVRVHEGPPAQSPRAFQPSQPSRNPSGRGALTRFSDVVEAFLLSRTVGVLARAKRMGWGSSGRSPRSTSGPGSRTAGPPTRRPVCSWTAQGEA